MPPTDPVRLVTLAAEHRMAGRLREALLHCDAAVHAAPGYADAWLERAFAFASGGSMARAAESYARVLAIDPGDVAAHAGLASIAARDGDAAAVRHHAAAALAGDPGNATATLALATSEIESGDPQAARALIEPLLARLTEPQPDRMEALALLGEALGKLGDHAGAYAAFARSKGDFAALHAAQFAGRPPHRAFVMRAAEALNEHSFAAERSPLGAERAAERHLFLLGYPRSGNTLVENVLASLPGVVALEERPTLRAADMAYLGSPEGFARLAAATADELGPLRAAYWDKVAEARVEVRGRTFVDMDPQKGTRLPVIARLFPEARVLVMRRDPRDVVWSCFRTNFALSNAALDYTTIEGAARHYDAMMSVIERARERLALPFHEVRYEALVSDFDATTQAMCRFAGIPWSAEVRRFDRTARQRGVATASGGQVRRGLFDGRRQWEPYAEWLAPAMPILAPWIERFGYD